MSTPLLAEIKMFAGNFAPRGYAFCQGQIMAISQNTALFSLLGTTYGGNGIQTFALPDLRGRAPLQPGQGPGLSNIQLGEAAGLENVTLLTTQMPTHTHTVTGGSASVTLPCTSDPGTSDSPVGRIQAVSPTGTEQFAEPGAANGQTATSGTANITGMTLGVAGGSQPHENRPPYLGINFIIALQGIFPSRN